MNRTRITPYLHDYDPHGDHAADVPADLPVWASRRLPLPPPADDPPHARYRDCSPRLGRWVQTDPVGYVEGTDLYAYVPAPARAPADPA